ncbi:MAG: dUTP diphosphatase [Bosea sp. (in: a-proteobacteria)]
MTGPASGGALPLQVFCFPHFSGLQLPAYATKGAAGLDLQAAIDENSTVLLKSGARALVPTGIALQLPEGYEAQVRPRSGLALKHGITVLNSPGTIDWDYRGELSVLLVNHGAEPFVLTRGQRIAQLVVAPVQRVAPVQIMDLKMTKRGSGGYGSTGV